MKMRAYNVLAGYRVDVYGAMQNATENSFQLIQLCDMMQKGIEKLPGDARECE